MKKGTYGFRSGNSRVLKLHVSVVKDFTCHENYMNMRNKQQGNRDTCLINTSSFDLLSFVIIFSTATIAVR